MSSAQVTADPVGSTEPGRVLASTRLPFAGYKHIGGPVAGLAASGFGLLVNLLDPSVSPLAVGFAIIGALNAYLLSLLNRNIRGTVVACAGGFVLGLVGALAVSEGLEPTAENPNLFEQAGHPLLFILFVPLLGAGPVLLAMFFQEIRPYGPFVRVVLAGMGGALGTVAGLVMMGMLTSMHVPEWVVLPLTFIAADYVLFRFQVICLTESVKGDLEQPMAVTEHLADQPDRPITLGSTTATPGPEVPGSSDRDDEP